MRTAGPAATASKAEYNDQQELSDLLLETLQFN